MTVSVDGLEGEDAQTCGREDLVPQGHEDLPKVLLIGAEAQAEEVCWTGGDDGRK